jgi:hypothetical protein
MNLARPIIVFALFGALIALYSAGALPEAITQHELVLNLFLLVTGLWALYEILMPLVERGNWG